MCRRPLQGGFQTRGPRLLQCGCGRQLMPLPEQRLELGTRRGEARAQKRSLVALQRINALS